MRIFILDKSYNKEQIYQLRKREKDYLIKVLRLKVGDSFTCRDIDNNFYTATIISDDTLEIKNNDDNFINLLDNLSSYTNELPKIRVYQAICKGKKNELIIRMLSEAGVEEVCFIKSEFSQVKELSAHELKRLEDIQREACQQSGSKTSQKEIRVIDIKDVVKDSPYPILFLHQSKRGSTLSLREALNNYSTHEISLIIGSEGGISDNECEYLENNNAQAILLSTNILRAETAGIFAVGAIESIWDKT